MAAGVLFSHLHDPSLPALERLGPADLARITGAARARLLRARYQPGARAVLHVALGDDPASGEGAIWFYAGSKGERLARELAGARHDPASGALFEAFPRDHRIPALARFVADAAVLAPALIGGPAARAPEVLRYRPGLSATFRWQRDDGKLFFVKQMPGTDMLALAQLAGNLADAARGLPVGFAPVVGIEPQLGLIAYGAARGRPADEILAESRGRLAPAAMMLAAGALRALWSLPVVPARMLDRAELLRRAEAAVRAIGHFDPDTGRHAEGLAAALRDRAFPTRLRPIHGDMKLEHLFLDGPRTTLVDMESLSLGDPDHDLARLEARLSLAAITGRIGAAEALAGRAELRRHAGPNHDWFLVGARLQCARFFAQRFDPATVPLMRRMLGAC